MFTPTMLLTTVEPFSVTVVLPPVALIPSFEFCEASELTIASALDPPMLKPLLLLLATFMPVIVPATEALPLGTIEMPVMLLNEDVFVIRRFSSGLPDDAVGTMAMPVPVELEMTQPRMLRFKSPDRAEFNVTPELPAPAPSISSPFNVTLPEAAVMVMPLLPAGSVIAAQPLPLMVTGPVMVSGPYLPGSSAATTPLAPTAV